MNGADLIANILKKEGIEILPCFPHSDIIDAGAKIGIRPIVVRQERHALHMADGYARTTGGQRICATTVQYGPGSENAYGAVAQCNADNVPVLHIPGGYPLSEQGVAPNFNASRNMQGINKWCEMALQAERLPQMLQSAFTQIRNGRPGTVTLEVPIDIFQQEVDPALLDLYKPQRVSTPHADPQDIKTLVDMILKASAPVIIAGQGILYAQASAELQRLAELTNTPVMSTLNGKSAFAENHPLYLGCAGGSRPDAVNRFLDKADLIVGLGTSFIRSPYITPFPLKGRTYAQLCISETDISKDYPVDFGVIGHAKPSIAAMVAEVEARGDVAGGHGDSLRAEIAAQHKAFIDEWMPLLTSDSKPINPYRAIWDLMHSVNRSKTLVSHEAGSPRDQTTAFYQSSVPHGYLSWGKTTQLGMSLGLVHGAKLARPDWHCFNIMGDAAIGMVGMDFETGVRCNIGTTTIVFKNSVMGAYDDYHPTATEKYAINELGGDYAGMAKDFGGYGETVTDPNEIKPAIARAIEQNDRGVPALLQMITCEEKRMAKKLPQEYCQ